MKKKKIIKSLLALVLVISLFALLTLGAFAYTPSDVGEPLEYGATDSAYADIENSSDGLIGAENDDSNGTESEFSNIFDTVYTALIENSDKLFSLLAFVASLIIALLYKKRLLPTVEGSFNTVATALTSFKSDTEKEITAQTGALSAVSTRLRETENVLMSLTDELSRISDELREGRLDENERERMKSVLLCEVDMLYDVFMQSSLPEYQKESVRERVASMKRALSEADSNEA